MPNQENQFYKEHFFKAIEKRFDSLDNQLEDIKKNHLEHIYGRLGKIERRIAYYMGGIAVLVIALDLILRYVIK